MGALHGYFSDPDPIRSWVRVLNVPQPAAGTEWQANPAAGRAFKILAALTSLTTDAVVASRFPGLVIAWGGVNVWQGAVPTAVTASLTVPVSYAPEVTSASQATAGWPAQLEIPPGWMPPDATVSSKTPGLDVGDQYAAVNLLIVEAWPSPHATKELQVRREQLIEALQSGAHLTHR